MKEQETTPVVALVGRPNVGKSTLFNRLTGTKTSLVHATPHTTRDVKSGFWDVGDKGYLLFDTCGLASTDSLAVQDAQEKSRIIIASADYIVLIVSGPEGWSGGDGELLSLVRSTNRPYCVVANKIDTQGAVPDSTVYECGEDVVVLSGLHGNGLIGLEDRLEAAVAAGPVIEIESKKETTLSIIGRPNVGKSTLFNRLLGDQRSVVSEEAGTTVDTVEERLVIGGVDCRIVDTAGARRQSKVSRSLEQVAVKLALEAIRRSHYVVYILDGEEGITHQDLRLIHYAWERNRSMVFVVNRIDLAEEGDDWLARMKSDVDRLIPQMLDVPLVMMSALTGKKSHRLLPLLEKLIDENRREVPTRAINDWLQKIQTVHPPRLLSTGAKRQRRRPRFFYGVQIRSEPITIRIFANFPGSLEESYLRYMTRNFKETFGVTRVPIAFQFQRGRTENKK